MPKLRGTPVSISAMETLIVVALVIVGYLALRRAMTTMRVSAARTEPLPVGLCMKLEAAYPQFAKFLAAKRQEWREYITQVSAWELENYLAKY